MQTKLRELFDYHDGNLIWKLSGIRGFNKTGQSAGAVNKGYVWVITKHITGVRRCFGLQRLIWTWCNGEIPNGKFIDHIDRNPLNNRIENLRLATPSENAQNATGKGHRPTPLPKNVYVDFVYKDVRKYRAQVCVAGEIYRVGGLSTVEAAVIEASKLRNQLHKRFAHVS